MTLEQVKEHFKNAEEVIDSFGDSVKMKTENIYEERGYFFADNHKGQGVILWTPLKGLSKITKYKKMKNTTKVSNELIKSYHKDACSEWKKRIENDFPELFPKLELEVGKWYKYSDADGYLFNITKLERNKVLFYGFTKLLGWQDEDICDIEALIPATDEEVEKALIDEAKKRGFRDGVKVKSLVGSFILTLSYQSSNYYSDDNSFYVCGILVFKEGKWATIIQPEKEIEVDGFTYVLKD